MQVLHLFHSTHHLRLVHRKCASTIVCVNHRGKVPFHGPDRATKQLGRRDVKNCTQHFRINSFFR